MDATDDDIEAGLLALGCLSAPEHAAARLRQAGDPAFAAAAQVWEARLLPLALALPAVEPPADLFARIERRLAPPAARTIRAADGVWRPAGPGVSTKLLHRMRDIGRQTILLRADAGSVLGEHEHDGDEEIFMISGDLTIGDIELWPGDYHIAAKGTRHSRATTRGGCLCLFVMAA